MNTEKENSNRDGLTILGSGETRYPQDPSDAKLELFGNPAPASDYTIEFETAEFTSLCPVTGQPDFAAVKIIYRPAGKCIESKSLKLYLFSYRNYRGFAEEIANRICSDLSAAADPEELTVDMAFTARGGVKMRVSSSYNRSDRK